MSHETEIVTRALQILRQGVPDAERERVEEQWWHPEVEYVEDPAWPGSSSYRGLDQVREAFEGYSDVIGGSLSVEEVIEGTEGVFALVTIAGETTGARIPWQQSFGYHSRVRDGKLSYLRAYLDVEEAKRDAGVT